MIESNFNHQTGILESKFEGDVGVDDIVGYIVSTKENKTFPRHLKIITDATRARFDFSIKDIETIIKENNASLEKYDFIIDAIVVDSPRVAALSMFYKELGENEKYTFEIFSTKERALSWLNQF
jgi:hypothetical protein